MAGSLSGRGWGASGKRVTDTPAPPTAAIPHLERLRTDFPFFARKCLSIRNAAGEIVPLNLNKAQLYLHERLEAQRQRTGKVRALIVKGRQLGSSTYIGARFFWRSWRSTLALRTLILTHTDEATSNLFGMTQRYYEYLPKPIKPPTKAASAKELVFADNGCSYGVATAGSKEIGRSDTIQLFHGSEVPSWPHAEEHMVSLGPALSKAPGTEWILESTAKGVGNVFYREAMAAIKGKSEYEALFIPWFWGEEYQTPCPSTHNFTDEWMDYGRLHGLTWEQLFWAYNENARYARAKSLDVERICPDFRQEFPATFDEAFQSSGDSFIPALSVLRARKPQERIIGRGPVILGIDPSRDRDRVGIVDRCGRVIGERICETWPPEGDTIYLAQKIARIIDRLQPDAVNIDVGGPGAGVVDWLMNQGYRCINPVNFGSAPVGRGPTGDKMYANRRAEMWDLCRDWFETPGGVKVPDSDPLHADLTAPIWGKGETRFTTNNALIIEDKEKIKERLGHSPDLGDAVVLTFAVPHATNAMAMNQPRPRRKVGRAGY